VKNVLPDFGAFVISLDFELYWGVKDLVKHPSPYDDTVLGARSAVHRLLRLFEKRKIATTWSVVGMLLAESDLDAQQYYPRRTSERVGRRPSVFQENIKVSSRRFYHAPELIAAIATHPLQEIGTHTFSHHCCLEAGQDREDFEEDLAAALAIAKKRHIEITSMTFPRNQIRTSYLDPLLKQGITAYRGTAAGWMYEPSTYREQRNWTRRAARLADSYIPLCRDSTVAWQDIQQANGLCNVRASRYLRPHLPSLRFLEKRRVERIINELETAGRTNRVFHLWSHPEDLGRYTEAQFENLGAILDAFDRCRAKYGMQSLGMRDVTTTVTKMSATESGRTGAAGSNQSILCDGGGLLA
jgi:hypothetical protein